QLDDFKVSYSDAEILDTGVKAEQPHDVTLQVSENVAADRNLSEPVPEISTDGNIPISANSGECYAKVRIPAKLKDEKLVFVKEEASYGFEVKNPEYVWEETKVLIKEPEENIEVIPAEYQWIDDQALFDTENGQVSSPVRKKIMVTPPRIVKHQSPAEYKAIKIKKLVKQAEIKRIEIPPVYDSVTLPIETQKAHYDWRQVLCATQITTDLVSRLQNALQKTGHYSGVVDGIFGNQTLNAIQDYQQDNNIAVGQITIETLIQLGIE
ncbi:MAG: peptidoglycan-binding domain-containing protein, partial [Gammaproteobacteria bacterium]